MSNQGSNPTVDEIIAEYLEQTRTGEAPDCQRLLDKYPEFADDLSSFFLSHGQTQAAGPPIDAPTVSPSGSYAVEATLPSSDPDLDAATTPTVQVNANTSKVSTKVRYFCDYELMEEIARGGMGVVYKARQISLNRLVALKMILAAQLAGEEDVQRFHAEAEAVANLDHPGIVPIYEIGEHEGQHYFSMSLIEGESLADKIKDGPLSPRVTAEYMKKVAEAVHYAHCKGIVHRDLKPANILVDADGTPKVTDFGLAKKLDKQSGLTVTGQVMGTPSYMPAEQASGKTEDVGPRTDVYALGAVLYCLLTGRPPFQASSPVDTLMQVLHKEPVAPTVLNPAVDRDLETICLKCLQKELDKRYNSADELVAELNRYLAGEPIIARSVTKLERVWRWCRRKPALASLWGSLLVLLVTLAIGGPLIAVQQASLRQQAEQAERQRALAQVDALLSANPDAVPVILDGLRPSIHELLPQLRRLEEGQLTEQERIRVSLGLLIEDSTQVDYLRQRLMDCEPSEFMLIRNSLVRHSRRLTEDLWLVAEDADKPAELQFRAACALAMFDTDNTRWRKIAEQVAQQLARQGNLSAALWVEALRPVSDYLRGPLAAVVRDKSAERATERVLATSIIADYSKDQPERLAALLLDVDAQQFAVLFPKMAVHSQRSINVLKKTIDQYRQAVAADSVSEELTFQAGNAAVGVLRLGASNEVWPLLRQSSDPRLRSYLIHKFSSHGTPVDVLTAQLDMQSDPGILQALLLTLGTFSTKSIGDDQRQRLEQKLFRMYTDAKDSVVHAGAGWLLTHWNKQAELEKINRQLGHSERVADRQWFVNTEGQTFVIVKPQEFLMGSPPGEFGRRADETQHRRQVARSFAIASREVTVAEFQRFLNEDPQPQHTYSLEHSPVPECPQTSVTWYEAAAYCNWLSRKDGIPESEWCFLPNSDGKYAAGMRMADDYLERTGYRLPTEAEWELACRAGTATSRFYGESPELLQHYAWYLSNALDRSWPVGTKQPNGLGLFDMHGNVWEWCADAPSPFPDDTVQQVRDVITEPGLLQDGQPRALRGGSYFYHQIYTRSALRNKEPVDARYYGIGCRPVRTLL